MKRVLFAILDIITIAFAAGIYGIRYFTKRKLGMVRWLNYFTKVYNEKMPLDTLKYVALVVAVIVLVLLLVFYSKKNKIMLMLDRLMILAPILLCFLYFWYTICNSYPAKPDYYFVMPIIGGMFLFQAIRSAFAMGLTHEK